MLKYVFVLFYKLEKKEKQIFGVYGDIKLLELAIKQIKNVEPKAKCEYEKELLIEG